MSSYHLNIDTNAGQTKIQQVVQTIMHDIGSGRLKAGDLLPSVNQLSSESGFSRDTIFKAYRILKKRNVIESAPAKGYFVTSETHKVFMMLDDFSAFKEQLYQAFRMNLPEGYSVDLLFHHYNKEVFRQLIQNSLGRYSAWVVMNIDHKKVDPVLLKTDRHKLLILDMGKPDDKDMNYLVQDFNKSVTGCLMQGLDQFEKYTEMILVYEEKNTPHPSDIKDAANRFCRNINMPLKIIPEFEAGTLARGQAYFVVRDSDLVKVIKSCRSSNLKVGKDVGIISYNDTPMKQVVEGGISVISTDFEMMGKKAAEFVKNRQPVNEVLPTYFIQRDSL